MSWARYTAFLLMFSLVASHSLETKLSPRKGIRRMIKTGDRVSLPAPATANGAALTDVLSKRRSIRDYLNKPVNSTQISQLLWAAQGVTNEKGYRTAPSAGAKYPLELYVVNDTGVYRYEPYDHELRVHRLKNLKGALSDAGYYQEEIAYAPVTFVIAGVYSRTKEKYGRRAERYVHMEAGHACENLLLQAVALDLGAVSIGAFSDDDVQEVLDLPSNHKPLYLVPTGWPDYNA